MKTQELLLTEKLSKNITYNLLTLFSFTEELVYTIGCIRQTRYSGKMKNEKYKKTFADFYNRLPTLDIFTADTDSELIQELLQQMNFHVLNSSVKLLGYDFNKAINAD